MTYSEKIGKAQRAIMLGRRAIQDDPRSLDVAVRLNDAYNVLTEVEHYIEALERRLAMLEDEGRERE